MSTRHRSTRHNRRSCTLSLALNVIATLAVLALAVWVLTSNGATSNDCYQADLRAATPWC